MPLDAATQTGLPARLHDIGLRLAEVQDPEVDESVVDMGFIARIAEEDGNVLVEFRLPTFWCSANFAYLMAEDMRSGIASLPWARSVSIRLVDHFAGEKISRGVSEGRPFEAVFEDAHGTLTEVRRKFLHKAFLGRQDDLLSALIPDLGVVSTLALTMRDLHAMTEGPHRLVVGRYLSLRRQFGGPAADEALAIVRAEGGAVLPEDFATYRRELRGALRAQRANAELCKMQLQVRYDPATNIANLERQMGHING